MAKPELTTHTDDVWGWLTLFLAATVLALIPLPAWTVDQIYSRAVYHMLQTWTTGLTNFAPFSILDVLILALAFFVGRRLILMAGAIKTRGVVRVGWEGVRRLARASAIVMMVFMVMWGFNYRRVPLMTKPAGAGPSPETLAATMSDVNVLAARLRDTRPVDMSFDAVADNLREPMNRALLGLGLEAMSQQGRPKYSLMLTPFFTWTGVDGMIDPLGLEAVVHPDLLPFERPFALAHEWAHLSGQADEGEASAIAWLACMNGSAPLAYSASLYLLRETGAALPADRRADAFERLDPGVRSDLVAIAQRLLQEQPTVQHAAFQIYDEYLRANRVEGGTESYGRALALILTSPIHDALVNYRTTGMAMK